MRADRKLCNGWFRFNNFLFGPPKNFCPPEKFPKIWFRNNEQFECRVKIWRIQGWWKEALKREMRILDTSFDKKYHFEVDGRSSKKNSFFAQNCCHKFWQSCFSFHFSWMRLVGWYGMFFTRFLLHNLAFVLFALSLSLFVWPNRACSTCLEKGNSVQTDA